MGVPLWAFRWRSCPQGRRATGYAHASVLRCAPHWANAHPPHASRIKNRTLPYLKYLLFLDNLGRYFYL
ncbi:MAG: hypothetical protein RML38_02515 [Bacteroidia bacterium]|nr:hypothetical protein [Bacteroidia bacterium]